jgi:hypothetical protein
LIHDNAAERREMPRLVGARWRAPAGIPASIEGVLGWISSQSGTTPLKAPASGAGFADFPSPSFFELRFFAFCPGRKSNHRSCPGTPPRDGVEASGGHSTSPGCINREPSDFRLQELIHYTARAETIQDLFIFTVGA